MKLCSWLSLGKIRPEGHPEINLERKPQPFVNNVLGRGFLNFSRGKFLAFLLAWFVLSLRVSDLKHCSADCPRASGRTVAHEMV